MERSRGLPENPAQARRAVAAAGADPSIPPVPALRGVSSNPSLAASAPLSSSQIVALAREAMRAALDEHETQAAEASGVSNDLRPGLTVNLSRKNIQSLPDEVVDIIKNELERLALSHNHLQGFPVRFSECTSLRYLNVRQNKIQEFPASLCDLKSLEILDLGRNKLRVLPPDIVKLSSLKVLDVQKNMIAELPLCLADMASLQVLKLNGNPIIFPPPEVLQTRNASPPNDGFMKDSEATAATAHIKRFLRQKAAAVNGRSDGDATGDESSEGTETPRPLIRRAMSGRFPIKVPNGTEASDARSPSLPRPPPIPTRSHYRGLSQQNTRRPGVMPLTIGNVNERLRSNSETLLQSSRSENRTRRMGMVSKKGSELGTLDEMQVNNRFSHYRGLSHGSAMHGPGAGAATKSPGSPAEPFLQRPVYVRRLSVLPERRREPEVSDSVLETAKGILYSVFQIHPMIQMLLSLSNDGTSKRSSLELVFYNTNAHVEELELEIQKHDPALHNGYGPQENQTVQSACVTLVNAYTHVCSLLANDIDLFIDNGDPRYIRTLLTQLYNSIMELRVTCTKAAAYDDLHRTARRLAVGDTIRPYNRGNSMSVMADRRAHSTSRPRNGIVVHKPTELRVSTDVPMPFLDEPSRIAVAGSTTPRSGESFASSVADSRHLPSEFTEDDRLFEKIFLSLQQCSGLAMRTLPNLHLQFMHALRNAMDQRVPDKVVGCYKMLVAECSSVIQQAETLQARLSTIKINEPGIRTQASFWAVCKRFVVSWASLGMQMKKSAHLVPLPYDMKPRLRSIQKKVKETTALIYSSSWADFFSRQFTTARLVASPDGSRQGGQSPIPMTPQSAALGPAVQATVPSTPQNSSFSSAFNGNVFERADALISMGGISMSRTGTMNSTSMSSFGYANSTMSLHDSGNGSSSVLGPSSGPGPLGPLPFRLNNGTKVAF